MDKQKQIEEMVKELAKDMGIAFQLANTTRFGVIAADLIEIGYRKIPEGAVVLTGAEYDRLLKEETLCERLGNDIDVKLKYIYELEDKVGRIRKETAEKFAERVKMAFYYEFDELIPSIMADKIDDICKEITEGKNE